MRLFTQKGNFFEKGEVCVFTIRLRQPDPELAEFSKVLSVEFSGSASGPEKESEHRGPCGEEGTRIALY